MLVAADNPVLVTDRLARTPNGMKLLIDLAETLGASVIDQGSRMNFPSRHPLNQGQRAGAAIAEADVIVGLEVSDFWSTVNSLRDQLHRSTRRLTRPNAKLITITTGDLYIRANYQDFRRMPDVDLAIAADGEATLPGIIEAVKRLSTADRRRAFQERAARLAEASRAAAERSREAASMHGRRARSAPARLCAELWAQIKNEDWSLVSSYYSDGGGWPRRLWDFNKPYQWLGHAGGGGIGYGAPASVGGALANRRHGRLSVAIQTDGDLMYAPGVLWTAAHHNIPILSVMNNNRSYHMEIMHVQRMCNARNRGINRGHDRQRAGRSEHRLREAGAVDGPLCGRADHQSEGSRPGPGPRDRRGQEGRAGARGRRDAGALSDGHGHRNGSETVGPDFLRDSASPRPVERHRHRGSGRSPPRGRRASSSRARRRRPPAT